MRGWLLVVLHLASLSLARAQEAPRSLTQATTRFELLSDFLVVVNGQAGGLDGLKFILDTGASHSVIDQKVADLLRLRREPGKVVNFNHEVPAEWTEIPELRVGPIRVVGALVRVGKLSDYSSLAENVDGIIGLDLLSRSKTLTIDYEKRAILWQLPEGDTAKKANWQYYVVRVAVQGHSMRLVLDTGLQGILLFADRLRQDLPNLRTEGGLKRVGFGSLRTTQVQLPGVRIAGPEIMATVFLIDGPADSSLPGVDGYLGVASLHAKRVQFDFEGMKIRWQ